MKLKRDMNTMCPSWNWTSAFQFQNEAAFDEIFQQANFNTFVFRSRVKLETYNVSKAAMIKCLQVCCHGIMQARLPQQNRIYAHVKACENSQPVNLLCAFDFGGFAHSSTKPHRNLTDGTI